MMLIRFLVVFSIVLLCNNCALSQQTPPTSPPSLVESTPVPPMKSHGKQISGDYSVELVSSAAMGWYESRDGKFVWVDPAANTNLHLEVILKNTIDQRPLPDAGVSLFITDQNNRVIISKPMIMLWSIPGYHYGNNFTLPAQGNYTVTISVTPPTFARHHKQAGNRFSSPAQVTFQSVALKPEGQFKE